MIIWFLKYLGITVGKDLVLKNWDFLGKTATTHHLYEKKLKVGYRRPKNLKDLIIRADVRTKKPKAVLF